MWCKPEADKTRKGVSYLITRQITERKIFSCINPTNFSLWTAQGRAVCFPFPLFFGRFRVEHVVELGDMDEGGGRMTGMGVDDGN